MNNKKPKVFIGKKDREIMYFLFQNKIATSKIIHKSLFPDITIRALNMRLRRLINEKFIERGYIAGVNYRPVQTVNLTPKGFKMFNNDYRDVKGIKLKSGKEYHDLMLTTIRDHLAKIKNIKNIWSENEIILNNDFKDDIYFKELKRVNSDAAIEVKWKDKSLILAIEYEASMKKNSRYHDKFISYYNQFSIDGVLYICDTKKIYNSLIYLENKYNDSSKSKIYYIEINDFLQSKEKFDFKSRKSKKITIFDNQI